MSNGTQRTIKHVQVLQKDATEQTGSDWLKVWREVFSASLIRFIPRSFDEYWWRSTPMTSRKKISPKLECPLHFFVSTSKKANGNPIQIKYPKINAGAFHWWMNERFPSCRRDQREIGTKQFGEIRKLLKLNHLLLFHFELIWWNVHVIN